MRELKRLLPFVAAVPIGWIAVWAMTIAAMSERSANCLPGALCLSDLTSNSIFFGSPVIGLALIWAISGGPGKRGDR